MSYYEKEVFVLRKSIHELKYSIKKVSSLNLQIGDIVYIIPNDLIPADVLLISGKCITDESLITGESTPCLKQEYSNLSPVSSINLLSSGTLCLSSKRIESHLSEDNISENHLVKNFAYGLVVKTGFYTVKGQLVRDLLFQTSTEFKFKKDSFKFLGIISIIVLIGFIWNIFYLNKHMDEKTTFIKIIIRSLDLITTAIPPSLPLSLLIGIEFSCRRLKKKKIYSLFQEKINEAGRIKLFCFDKTGTLTENSLLLNSVIIYEENNFKNFSFQINDNILDDYINKNKTKKNFVLNSMREAMGVCHTLSIFNNEIIGDSLEVLMLSKSGFLLKEVNGSTVITPSLKIQNNLNNCFH